MNSSSAPLKVLVVDDHAVNALLLKVNFRDLGHKVAVAGDGVEALELAERFPFDVVLMDVMMPRMNGIEATREILARKPALPIIGITADETESTRRNCLDAGMRKVFMKPIDFDALMLEINVQLGTAS